MSYKATPEYNSWCAMKQRCYYKSNNRYDRYGGRGIVVCDRWKTNFQNFLEDMGKRPSPKHSIDRINNDGNYEPSNCRWASNLEQSNNRSNRIIDYNGLSLTIREWSSKLGISYKTLRQRIFVYNWPVDKAINTKVRGYTK